MGKGVLKNWHFLLYNMWTVPSGSKTLQNSEECIGNAKDKQDQEEIKECV